jgi:cyclopropane fatty-acyl-phospholipid synthase-like methyltransferase
MSDARQYAPATDRNRDPILNVLLEVLPPTGTVLEISSGTGEHAAYLAPRLKPRRWIPTDLSAAARDSIEAWRQEVGAENLDAPIALDASQDHWTVEAELAEPIGAIVNINMIHIAPWSACLGLMAGAGRILPKGGILYLYGPFKQNGQHTAPSNQAFDESLRMRDREWGVRDLEAVIGAAEAAGLSFVRTYAMPANNLSVIFQA